jgi:D-3-phosphoglycerate dehydrogenase
VDWSKIVRRERLQWIQSSAAGLDHCLDPAVVESEIMISSASGVLADQVAEHTMCLIGAVLRRLPLFLEAQGRREFVRRPTRDLHGATVGIVGFGGVGRRLAELLAPYRVRIVATDYFPVDPPDHVEAVWPREKLPQLLAESDVVVLCLPLTVETRCLIDKNKIESMKPQSVLVNVCRGPVVVEDDLVAALRSGHISAAAIDVTCAEPLPAESSLWDAPNLLITPHVAGQAATRIDRMTRFFCENLSRYQQGQPLVNLVDKQLGFPRPGR